jgi:hypothetical protein
VMSSAGMSAGVIAARSFQSRVSGREQEKRPASARRERIRKAKIRSF